MSSGTPAIRLFGHRQRVVWAGENRLVSREKRVTLITVCSSEHGYTHVWKHNVLVTI